MRAIDADALEELFREVIGDIAKKPEMSGNLEHMVRASAMVIEMIKDAPTIEPQRKKGKWIPVTREVKGFPQCTIKWVDATKPDEVDGLRCSECDTVYDFTEARNWCSECGADMREDAKEPKKCDTCRHVKSQWFNRCADCNDYELWEGKTNERLRRKQD